MKNAKRLLSAFLVLTLIFSMSTGLFASAAGGTLLTNDSATFKATYNAYSAKPGQTFNVTISCEAISAHIVQSYTENTGGNLGLGGLTTVFFQFVYDAGALEYVSTAPPSSGLATGLEANGADYGTPTNSSGLLTYNLKTTTGSDTANALLGTGNILVATFKVKDAPTVYGATNIKFWTGSDGTQKNPVTKNIKTLTTANTIYQNINTTFTAINSVNTVAITGAPATVKLGNTAKLGATVTPVNTNYAATYPTVSWTADGSVSVLSDGTWTANSLGAGSITATADGKSDTWNVNVIPSAGPLTSVSVNDPGTLSVNAIGAFGYGKFASDAIITSVAWSSDNSNVIEITDAATGAYKAKAPGSANISVLANGVTSGSRSVVVSNEAPTIALVVKDKTSPLDKTLTLTLDNCYTTQSYQVWLEQISANGTSFGWVLLQSYTAALTSNSSLDFKVQDLSPQYRIYVRYKVGNGTATVATQLFNLKETTEPVITSLTCTPGTQSNGVVYDTFVKDNQYTISLASIDGNSVKWFVDGIEETGTSSAFTFVSTTAGTHTVSVEVANGALKVSSSIRFALTDPDATFVALADNSNNFGFVGPAEQLNKKKIVLDLTGFGLKSGSASASYKFAYGEPNRGVQNSTAFGLGNSGIFDNINYPGTYSIFGYLSAQGKNAAEDYIVRSVKVSRSSEVVTVTTDYTLVDGTYTITATGHGLASGAYQYSFWRVDANGYNLVQGWSSDANANVLTWRPVRAGKYKILARVRGEKALDGTTIVPASKGTYEDQAALNFTNVPTTAFDSLTESNLTATGVIKRNNPITLSVSGVSDDTAVYQFLVYDVNRGISVIREFSNSSTCTWVPNKSGDYTIYARINRGAAFGFADKEIQISNLKVN